MCTMLGGVVGRPTTRSWAWAMAGRASIAPASRPALALRIFLVLPFAIDWTRRGALLSALAFELEFGFARLLHQCSPDALAQLGEARQPERLARARLRQIDGDDLVDARGPPLQHDHPVAEQHGLLDRMGDEDHGGRPLLPDAQQLEL